MLWLVKFLLGETELQQQRRRLRKRVQAVALKQLSNANALAASRLEQLQAGGEPFYKAPTHPLQDAAPGAPSALVTRWEQDPLFGWAFDLFSSGVTDGLFGLGLPSNAFPREMWPERPTTLRTQIAQDVVRLQSRVWYETLPFYSGPIGHLRNYVCGTGITCDAVALEPEEAEPAYEQDLEPQDGPEGEASDTAEEPANPNDGLAAEIQAFLDESAKFRVNELQRRVRDSVTELLRDGEIFTRVLPPPAAVGDEPDVYPELATIDPSWIRGAHNEITGPWSYGILTGWPRRQDDVKAFHVWYPDNSHEDVSPDVLKHAKLETTSANVKRGIPLGYKLRKQLPQMGKLLDCMAVGEAARQAIPYIRQFAAADRSAVRAATPSYIDAQDVAMHEYEAAMGLQPSDEIIPGQVPLINKGQEYQETPQGRAESGTMAYRTLAEACACATNLPLWFFTGTADQENYASSLVSESPLVKTVTGLQGILSAHWSAILTASVDMAAALGRFPVDWKKRVQIHCEFPSPIARDPDKAVDSDLKLLDKKLLSPQHVCVRNGLDFDEERDLTEQAEAMGWQAQSPADMLALEQPGQPGGEAKPPKPSE